MEYAVAAVVYRVATKTICHKMLGMEDGKEHERVVEDVSEDTEKAMPSPQQEVVFIS